MRKIARSIAATVKRNVGKIAAAGAVATAATMNTAHAAFDTNVTALASDALDFFNDDIKPLKIAVVAFVIVLSYVGFIKGRR